MADCGNDRVSVFDPCSGDYLRTVGNGRGSGTGQFFDLTGLLVQSPSVPGGGYLLYVTDSDNYRVQVFNASTGIHLQCIGNGRGSGPGQFIGPVGGVVLCPSQGNRGGGGVGNSLEVFVPDFNNHRVSVFDSTTGAFLRHIGVGQLRYPSGLALSLTGVVSQGGDYLLYVSETGKKRVQIFNARTGVHVGFLGVGLLNSPNGLKIYPGSEGKSLLFVSDQGNKKVEVLEVEA